MKKILLNIIRDWVGENKKIFWKYEVSCYYETYKIRIVNLPAPSKEDIMVSTHNRLLNNDQKIQLCNIIKKACSKAGLLSNSYINVKVDYVRGAVIAAVN